MSHTLGPLTSVELLNVVRALVLPSVLIIPNVFVVIFGNIHLFSLTPQSLVASEYGRQSVTKTLFFQVREGSCSIISPGLKSLQRSIGNTDIDSVEIARPSTSAKAC